MMNNREKYSNNGNELNQNSAQKDNTRQDASHQEKFGAEQTPISDATNFSHSKTSLADESDILSAIRESAKIIIDAGDTAFFVNPETGEFVTPISEGTTGIMLFAGRSDIIEESGPNSAEAIKIPRLLHLDELLNFHIAEICYHENLQAMKVSGFDGLEGAKSQFRTGRPISFANIPQDEKDNSNCFIGFYLSPNSNYKLTLLSEEKAWPKDFSDYLNERGWKAEQLYNAIAAHSLSSSGKSTFEDLIFLPDLRLSSSLDHESQLEKQESVNAIDKEIRLLGRSKIENTYSRKDIGGWWFNVPISRFNWLTADLERLLTSLLEDDFSEDDFKDTKKLASWKPRKWIRMIQKLTLGLENLHTKGLVHGDPRPANIMAKFSEKQELLPDHFRWIDVGLGYSHSSQQKADPEPHNDTLTMIQTPAPLGGGRVTPFYAPERIESVEFEDADLIKLKSQNNGSYKLQFFWKRRTYEPPIIMQLRKDNKPLRELGTLEKGDRVQLREFIFDVQEVKDDYMLISNIYEIAMDRVLIGHRQNIHDQIVKKLASVAISRYRIFKQWGEATDIFGLGIIVLYIFFIRGLLIQRFSAKRKAQDPNTKLDLKLGRSNREKIFCELANILRSQSFLNGVIESLEGGAFGKKDDLWIADILQVSKASFSQKDPDAKEKENPDISQTANVVSSKENTESSEDSHATRINKVVEYVLAMDRNFQIILIGLNKNNGLFTLILYFCLCCVWRRSDFDDEWLSNHPIFEPYCLSRLKITDDGISEMPAAQARADLETIEKLINRIGISEEVIPEIDNEEMNSSGYTRDEQFVAHLAKQYEVVQKLRDDLNATNKQLQDEKKKKTDLAEQFQNRENKLRYLLLKESKVVEEFLKSKINELEIENLNKSQEIKQLATQFQEANSKLNHIPLVIRNIFEKLGSF